MASLSDKLASNVNFGVFAKAKELQQRLLFTLLALIIYRLGTHIPFPGLNPQVLHDFFSENSGGLLGMFNAFTGGALSRMSIFALNIMPYISASIIVQLAASIVPSLIALKKEGESGQRKINQYTRYLTVFITVIQAFFMARALEAGGAVIMSNHHMFELSTVVSLLGGTMFVVWLGEQITSRGVGNGASLLITVGIVSGIPGAFARVLEENRTGTLSTLALLGVLALVFVVIYIIVMMERAQRRIVVHYPKRQVAGHMAMGSQSHLPLKINPTGVMPPIFASALLAIPVSIVQMSSKASENETLNTLAAMLSPGHWLYMLTFATLIVFFAFFYTGIQSNPKDTAENLKKQGGFIAGIRPGASTAEYLDYVITRLTVLGAFYLATLCILPEFLFSSLSLPFFLGGTSLLIVVTVLMDTVSQIQSHLIAHQYEGLIRKAKLKGRF